MEEEARQQREREEETRQQRERVEEEERRERRRAKARATRSSNLPCSLPAERVAFSSISWMSVGSPPRIRTL